MKYLIINADDFGYNPQQNEAITYLLNNKLITSTSVMTVAPKADECKNLKGDYSVGVHLTINSDSENDKWQSLTGAKSLGGNDGLPTDQKKLTFGARRKDVFNELCAQYDYMKARGITPDHADNHCGTLYGINMRRFYIDAFDFCSKYNLPYRFPKSAGFIERQLGRNLPKAVYSLQQMIVKKGTERNVKMLDDLISNPWGMDKITGYDVIRNYYLDCLDNLQDGVTEMFLHPALPVNDKISPWTKRVYEYELLKSGDLLQKAKDNGIEVVGWDIFNQI